MAGCVLLHEARASDPAGKPFHGEGAIRDEGKHAPCDGAVVPDNLTLGDAVSWEEDEVAAGDLHRPEPKDARSFEARPWGSANQQDDQPDS